VATQKTRIAELERELEFWKGREAVLTAQLPMRLKSAIQDVKKLGSDKLKGSGVIVGLRHLDGTPAAAPFALYDGLGPTLIAAFEANIKRSLTICNSQPE